MTKHVIFKSDAFTNPNMALFLGLNCSILGVLSELINIYGTLQFTSIDLVMGRFVSYAVLFQIPVFYMKQRRNFPLKGVGKLTLTKDNKDQANE